MVKLTDRRWWATQTPERLAQSAALLGVHPGLPVPDADAIAFRLELSRLVLREAADAYAHARGRGRVLIGVLDQLANKSASVAADNMRMVQVSIRSMGAVATRSSTWLSTWSPKRWRS